MYNQSLAKLNVLNRDPSGVVTSALGARPRQNKKTVVDWWRWEVILLETVGKHRRDPLTQLSETGSAALVIDVVCMANGVADWDGGSEARRAPNVKGSTELLASHSHGKHWCSDGLVSGVVAMSVEWEASDRSCRRPGCDAERRRAICIRGNVPKKGRPRSGSAKVVRRGRCAQSPASAADRSCRV